MGKNTDTKKKKWEEQKGKIGKKRSVKNKGWEKCEIVELGNDKKRNGENMVWGKQGMQKNWKWGK